MPRRATTTKKTSAKKKSTTTRKKTTTTARNTSNTTRAKKMTLGNPGQLDSKIREKAYEIYEQRGGWHGADMEDWLRAEQEVKKELATV